MWREMQTPLGRMSFYKQDTQTTCNIACGLMMIKALTGIELSESTLIHKVTKHVSPDRIHFLASGYTLDQLVNALVEYFKPQVRPEMQLLHTRIFSDDERLKQVLKQAAIKKPAIASVENPDFAHAVLVVGHSNHSFVVVDPQFGLRGLTWDEFPRYTLMPERKYLRLGRQVVTSWGT